MFFVAFAEVYEVPEEAGGIILMDGLADEGIEAHHFDEFSVLLGAAGEKFGEDYEFGISLAGFPEEVVADVQGGAVGVIDAESVEDFGHLLDVVFHSFPEHGGVLLGLPVTELNEVRPDDYLTSEVVKFVGISEVFLHVLHVHYVL